MVCTPGKSTNVLGLPPEVQPLRRSPQGGHHGYIRQAVTIGRPLKFSTAVLNWNANQTGPGPTWRAVLAHGNIEPDPVRSGPEVVVGWRGTGPRNWISSG